jgi:hypothetical protein
MAGTRSRGGARKRAATALPTNEIGGSTTTPTGVFGQVVPRQMDAAEQAVEGETWWTHPRKRNGIMAAVEHSNRKEAEEDGAEGAVAEAVEEAAVTVEGDRWKQWKRPR